MAERAQVHVQFYMKAVEDKKASRDAGRPVFKDMEYVKIKFPGDPKRELHAPAHEKAYLADKSGTRESYAQRYAEHYKLFKASAEQVVGTPLAELPFLTEAQRATLRAASVMTAEQLAGLSDRDGKKFGMNWRAMKDQAKAYLDNAAGSADTAKLAAENAEMAERLKAMEAMLAEIQKAKEAEAA